MNTLRFTAAVHTHRSHKGRAASNRNKNTGTNECCTRCSFDTNWWASTGRHDVTNSCVRSTATTPAERGAFRLRAMRKREQQNSSSTATTAPPPSPLLVLLLVLVLVLVLVLLRALAAVLLCCYRRCSLRVQKCRIV